MAHVFFFLHVHCMIVIHFQACAHVISNAHKLITSLGLGSGMGRMNIHFLFVLASVIKS